MSLSFALCVLPQAIPNGTKRTNSTRVGEQDGEETQMKGSPSSGKVVMDETNYA